MADDYHWSIFDGFGDISFNNPVSTIQPIAPIEPVFDSTQNANNSNISSLIPETYQTEEVYNPIDTTPVLYAYDPETPSRFNVDAYNSPPYVPPILLSQPKVDDGLDYQNDNYPIQTFGQPVYAANTNGNQTPPIFEQPSIPFGTVNDSVPIIASVNSDGSVAVEHKGAILPTGLPIQQTLGTGQTATTAATTAADDTIFGFDKTTAYLVGGGALLFYFLSK